MKPFARSRPGYTLDRSRLKLINGEKGWLYPFTSSTYPLSQEEAERILGGEFRIFSETLNPEGDIMPDWHLDQVHGHRFEKAPAGKIRINDIGNADCLFPCELSRLQFLLPLFSRRDLGEDRERLGTFVRRVVENWTRENPPGTGIHWRMHMELAIRALSIVTVLPFLREDTAALVFPLAAECIRRVAAERVLRPPAKRHNHYLIELVCTIIVSDAISDRKILKARKRAFPALIQELDRQFNDDGANFECSLSYHRLTVEALLILLSYMVTAAPEDQGARDVSDSLERLLPKSVGFVADYSGCMGRSPQFGDSSDGRILFGGDYYAWDPRDHGYLLRAATKLGISPRETESIGETRAYLDSGYAFIRRGKTCIAACNPVITSGASGHTHLDRLSWTLAVNGKPVFIDPGTWMYNSDPSLRRYFKSTGSHNTVMIDGEEQAVTDFSRAFSQVNGIACTLNSLQNPDGPAGIEMSHTGYERLQGVGAVCRRIEVHRNRITVRDILDGTSSHSVSMGYLTDPRLKSVAIRRKSFHLLFEDITVIVTAPDSLELRIEDRWYSASYGEKEMAKRLVMLGEVGFPAEIVHHIELGEVSQLV